MQKTLNLKFAVPEDEIQTKVKKKKGGGIKRRVDILIWKLGVILHDDVVICWRLVDIKTGLITFSSSSTTLIRFFFFARKKKYLMTRKLIVGFVKKIHPRKGLKERAVFLDIAL